MKRRLQQWAWSIVSLAIALIPAWTWLAIFKVVAPTGFWQRFAVVGGGLFVFGGVQLVMLFLWIFILVNVVLD